MDFIYKLFPYKSLTQFDGDSLTVYWVLLILVIFLYYSLRLIFITYNIKLNLKGFSEERIKKHRLFAQVWDDYQQTFIDYRGTRKTDELAYTFFNEQNLLSVNTNLRLINAVPALLVGLGILGTFIGLTYGISNFQTNSTEEIKLSIETLLSGMGTAFVTSIHGMFFSLLFTFIEKTRINSLHHAMHRLCYTLDKQYKISKEDERAILFSNQEQLLKDYFLYQDGYGEQIKPGQLLYKIYNDNARQFKTIQHRLEEMQVLLEKQAQLIPDLFQFTDEQGNLVKPGNILRDIYIENEKQSAALQSFSTDLANIIEAGFERIINDPNNGIIHELVSIKTAIHELVNKIQDPATDLIAKVVEDLKVIIQEFKESLTGSTKRDIEDLMDALIQVGSTLVNLPTVMQTLFDDLQNSFDKYKNTIDTITIDTTKTATDTNDAIIQNTKELGNTMEGIIQTMTTQLEELLVKQMKGMAANDELINTVNVNIEQLNNLTTDIRRTLEEFRTVHQQLRVATGQFQAVAEQAKTSTENLQETQHEFMSYDREFREGNSATIQELRGAIEKARQLSVDYVQHFGGIEEGLKDVFDSMENGLTRYDESVRNSLDQYLQKFTEALTATASSLNTSYENLTTILEDMNDHMDGIKNRLS
jgi:hypothetical protein